MWLTIIKFSSVIVLDENVKYIILSERVGQGHNFNKFLRGVRGCPAKLIYL